MNSTNLGHVLRHNLITNLVRPKIYQFIINEITTINLKDDEDLSKFSQQHQELPWPLSTLNNNNPNQSSMMISETNITSLGGIKFTSYYKSSNYHVDLFGGIVAPRLHQSLWAESYRQNPGNPLKSNCSSSSSSNSFNTENIEQIKINFFNNQQSIVQFDTVPNEHSKWAISSSSPITNPVFCIGDLSRMENQFNRAGGATCLVDNNISRIIWTAFHSIINKVEKC